jgi:hypothetical protein
MNDTLCSLIYHFEYDSVVNEKALTANQGVLKSVVQDTMGTQYTPIVSAGANYINDFARLYD